MRRRGRWAVTTIGFAAVTGLALPAVPAHAGPGGSLTQAKKNLAQLNDQVDKLNNQYNQAMSNWQAAKKRLAAMEKSVKAERKTFQQLRLRVAQLAAAAYKSGDNGDIPELVSAKNPTAVLNQMSAFNQLAHNRAAEFNQYLASAQRIEREEALRQQAEEQLRTQKSKLDKEKTHAQVAVKKQLKLVEKLGANIDPGSSKQNCSILATGRAETVLKYACAQLGKSYVFGAAGPDHFDCSGLTMMAFKQVGINLHHWVPDQHSASRPVSKADLQPGDLVFFNHDDHVGIFVGHNMFIQAPHTGDVVKISSLSDSWYTSTWNGGGRLL